MHSRSPEQSASFQKTSRPGPLLRGHKQKPVQVDVRQQVMLQMGCFRGSQHQPAPMLIPGEPCPWLSRLACSGTTAPQRAKPALHSAWLACGECCVYQASEGMLGLQDNGFSESQKKLNSLPRWKIVPFHPLYNNSSFILL